MRLISNAAVNNLQFHQMDVKSAFLNAPLNGDIFLAVPEGINIPTSKVLHHNKAIYGLKQAPLAWYNHLAKWLISKRNRSIPKLGLIYRSIIGALSYISTNTRPDITFAISHLSQFLEKPGLEHWTASLQVLCYLYHTKERTLNYHNRGKCNIICYTDADWGNLLIDQRSVGGYTLFLNHHLISWQTKKQQTISHSTTKAKYKSLSDASKEILWFQQLLQEIDLDVPGNIPTLYTDNKGAIDLSHSNINHNGFKTKHMDIKFHFIRDLIKNLKLELFHVSTHLMAADFLTEVVGETILLRSKSFINLY
ncbi:hypothetical protein O181_033015 [Austropuccinia psidii MF-1]|uniref:Reverse transcriptase Ty1/copia-type domain-containing protein n=1 Tax=Austropuccinia psidii MF-1 TaxID=1389203 RepID=A0A9Q3H8T1_9BASI|nr:hypothetical protein [Austropuccinia psidii MF-1]